MKVTAAATIGLLAASVRAAEKLPKGNDKLPVISIKGNAFFYPNGTRFYMRGVDYQPGGPSNVEDPLRQKEICDRDLVKFKELKINTIRVYSVDNSGDPDGHAYCMNALAEAGIYLVLDVNHSDAALNRNANATAKSYNAFYLGQVFRTVDIFQSYSNTLAFLSANEVINDDTTTPAAPYVKAVTRDIKSYINSRKYRKIPVGYSAADVESNRVEMAQYMACGPDAATGDFYGFNDYSWCDPATFANSDWQGKLEAFSTYNKPIFLSEYGCKKNKRTFNAVGGLYSDKVTPVYSGGLVYEYSEEEGVNFGLVNISNDNKTVSEKDDFKALKAAFDKTPMPTGDGGFKTDNKAPDCPKQSKKWDVDMPGDKLPKFPADAKKYLDNGAPKGLGLKAMTMDSGSDEVEIADAVDGAVTTGSTTDGSSKPTGSAGAAAGIQTPTFGLAPVVAGAVIIVSSLFGASLI